MALNLKKLANYIMTTFCLILIVVNTSLGQDVGKLTSFKGYDGVRISKTDHIEGPRLTTRQIPTSKGLVRVSRMSGTRIIYVNNENVPFVKQPLERLRYPLNTRINLIQTNREFPEDFNEFNLIDFI